VNFQTGNEITNPVIKSSLGDQKSTMILNTYEEVSPWFHNLACSMLAGDDAAMSWTEGCRRNDSGMSVLSASTNATIWSLDDHVLIRVTLLETW
jgi:hypothetical protein